MPVISVVIPTHNRPEMLEEALASVRAQTFTDHEIIVVSNGESARNRGRSQALAVLANAWWFELDEGNVSAARNFGIAKASGEWVAFLDDDDLWLPVKLEHQMAAVKRTGADTIACDFIEFHPDGREIIFRNRCPAGWTYVKAISRAHWSAAMGSGPLIRKSIFSDVGGFDPKLRCAEDMDMARRLSWRHSIYQMDEVLMRYRRGHASLTAARRTACRYDILHFRKMCADTPVELRSALPSWSTFVLPRLIILSLPQWLFDALVRLRPRHRWILLRRKICDAMRKFA